LDDEKQMSKKTKIYTLGREESVCYGHGDYGKETVIREQNCYGLGLPFFYPFFRNHQEAVVYRNSLMLLSGGSYGLKIVEVELWEL